MKPITYKLLICFLFICANTNSVNAQVQPNLDGNSYSVKLIQLSGSKGGTSWKEDTFIFESGELHCLRMRKKEGFASALYNPTNNNSEQDPTIKFTYFHTNKYGSSLKIEGIAQGKVIEGTARWRSDLGEHKYSFTGVLL